MTSSDVKAIGAKLQAINDTINTKGEYKTIGELYGFQLLVKTEASMKEGFDFQQNRFFVGGEYKYSYNNGNIAADPKLASLNFLNALERIPRYMEQYKTTNEKLEQDIPVLQEVVGGVWKREDELKNLKSDLAALERKIQISLKPTEHSTSDEAQGKSTTITPDTNGQPHSIESPQTNGQSNAVGESVGQATTHSLTDSRLSVGDNVSMANIPPPKEEQTKPRFRL